MTALDFDVSEATLAASCETKTTRLMNKPPSPIAVTPQEHQILVRLNEGSFDDEFAIDACRKQIRVFARNQKYETVVFDLTGIPMVTSAVLGLFVQPGSRRLKVRVVNPSEPIQDKLKVTHLDELIDVEFS